jgi:hypothetical protein
MKKTSLLYPDTIAALEAASFAPEFIEFLGWLPGNAHALNNSKNPVKAAHTLLSREGNVKMLQKFFEKKQAALVPDEPAEHTQADSLLRDFRRFMKGFEPAYSQEEVDSYAPDPEDR